jgi:hypothetical protein
MPTALSHRFLVGPSSRKYSSSQSPPPGEVLSRRLLSSDRLRWLDVAGQITRFLDCRSAQGSCRLLARLCLILPPLVQSIADYFFGIVSDNQIATIHLGLSDSGTDTGSFGHDNLTIGRILEPSAVMLAAGLVVIGTCRRHPGGRVDRRSGLRSSIHRATHLDRRQLP